MEKFKSCAGGKVAVIGALDTKAEEVSLVAEELRRVGLWPLIIDVGILGRAETKADIDRDTVARAAGAVLATLIAERHSGRALAAMSAGVKSLLMPLVASGEVAAVFGIGGSRGTVIAAGAMRDLPLGLPKMIVTTSLVGVLKQVVGSSDIVLVPTVADLLGVNRITAPALRRSVRMLASWLDCEEPPASQQPTVALTSFGVTTPCVAETRRLLLERGFDVVVFPANGLGGPAMERMAEQGSIQGIIDVTTHEIADTLFAGMCSTTEQRLNRSGTGSIPRLVSFGALDFVNFQANAVPAHFADRLIYEHSSAITLMRTNAEESRRIGAVVAERLVASSERFAVLCPLSGFSEYDRPGGPFWQPEADVACKEAMRDGIAGSGTFVEDPRHINEPEFARRLVSEYLALASI